MENSQTRFPRRLPAVALATLIAVSLLGGVFVMLVHADAGILNTRSPAPPQAILNPGGVERYRSTFTYLSQPNWMAVLIIGPDNHTYSCDFYDETGNTPVSSPPIGLDCDTSDRYRYHDIGTLDAPIPPDPDFWQTPSLTWAVPITAPNGSYLVYSEYWSDVGREAFAGTTFYVYDVLGNLVLYKFDDTNGNGTQEGGELGLKWHLGFTISYPFNDYYEYDTLITGTKFYSVPGVAYTVTEFYTSSWSQTTPTISPYTVSVTNSQTTTATFGNIQNSTGVCNLGISTPERHYVSGSNITYTLSLTKTGNDDGIVPTATLGFVSSPTYTIPIYDSDSDGGAYYFPGGDGSMSNPYKWVFTNFGTLTQTKVFTVYLHFAAAPANDIFTATTQISTTYMNTTPSNLCQNVQKYDPTAVTFSHFEARSGANNGSPLVLGSVSAAILAACIVLVLRRRQEQY